MKRICLFLLLIGAMFGLMVQQPVQAFAVPPAAVDMPAPSRSDISVPSRSDMAVTSRSGMASIPDCMSTAKRPTRTPCKCGVAGCAAMMAPGVLLMPTDPMTAMVAASRTGNRTKGVVAALHGRTTAPEPEPPAILI